MSRKWTRNRARWKKKSIALCWRCPTCPAEDVVAGGKENNQVVKVVGEKPTFDWEPKNHVDLCVDLGLIDYERGVKMGGNGFWLYNRRGRAAGMGTAQLLYQRASQGRLHVHAAPRTF